MADCGRCYRSEYCDHRYTSDIKGACSEYWQQGEWIPCDQIMPDINYQQKVLLVTIQYEQKREVRRASYHVLRGMPNHWRCGGNRIDNANVVAWLPIPKPYKEDEKTDQKGSSSS